MAAVKFDRNSWCKNSCWCHSSGKPHAMDSCGTADGTILLKELLGQGLATSTEGDSAVLCTPGTSLGDSSPSFATEITLCPAKLSCSNDACILEIQFHSTSTHSILRPNSLGLPLLQMHIDELRGESLGLGSPNFGAKAKNRRLFLLAPVCVCQAMTMQGATASDCQPWCLHIFAAVATNISETRFHGSSQKLITTDA